MHVLITGGAGFIGSRLAKRLAAAGHRVTVFDNLSEQKHNTNTQKTKKLEAVANCVRGDVCDRDSLARELANQEVVVHLAAEPGTGQSMYAIQRYERANLQGTACLLDVIVTAPPPRLCKMVVASSRAIYGEGKYQCAAHGSVFPRARTATAMSAGRFEAEWPVSAEPVTVLPTSEDTPFAPSSFYGLTKQVQEQMVLMFGAARGLDALALRYQNVYGPGQSMSNPYAGLLAVFSNLVRQGKPLQIFEDGLESRDFVYVDDVVDATAACLSESVRGVHSLNVGSGVRTTVLEVAEGVRAFFKSTVPVQITGKFRVGDIRHNVADTTRIHELTGFVAKWQFTAGLARFLEWAQASEAGDYGFERSLSELEQRGLLGGR